MKYMPIQELPHGLVLLIPKKHQTKKELAELLLEKLKEQQEKAKARRALLLILKKRNSIKLRQMYLTV